MAKIEKLLEKFALKRFGKSQVESLTNLTLLSL